MTAAHIVEMMSNWNKAQAAARIQFPEASEEAIYQMVKAAMNVSLGL